MIDLHLHTTASDGLLPPDALVQRVQAAGVTTLSVTDHDTVSALAEASRAASADGLRFLPGIEITSVENGRDLHLLGYGIDPASPALLAFLARQRESRRARVAHILDKLDSLGLVLDRARVESPASAASTKAIGRPHVARALVAAGHTSSVDDAFERWLGPGRPAFVPREGPTPAAVIAQIHEAGGAASLAHPGVSRRDALVPQLAALGLDALEVWHSDHDEAATAHYHAMAVSLGLLMTGGSDFHGDNTGRRCALGGIPMPESAFDQLLGRLAERRTARAPLQAREERA